MADMHAMIIKGAYLQKTPLIKENTSGFVGFTHIGPMQ